MRSGHTDAYVVNLMVGSYNALVMKNGRRDNTIFVKKVRGFIDSKRSHYQIVKTNT